MEITTNSKELAELLDNYATDWFETLKFLEHLGNTQGVILDMDAVILELKKLQGDLD